MAKKYKSRVNDFFIWTCEVILTLFGGTFILFSHTRIWGILFLLLVILILLAMFFGSWYIMKEDYLLIRCLAVETYQIPYKNILNVTSVKNHERDRSPALSSSRIRIDYMLNGKITWLHISPKNQEEFLQLLREKVYQANKRCG